MKMAKHKSRTPGSNKLRRKRGISKAIKTIAFSLAAVLAVSLGLGYAIYQDLNKSVQSEEYTGFLNKDREVTADDPLEGRAVNYVLIGSDSRADGNAALGGGVPDEGQRSDTTIIAHVAADRSRVDLISIPRDSIVDIPSCKLSNGNSTSVETNAQFNAAFSKGDNLPSAVACTINTIEMNTGIYIDGYAVVDFLGFEKMVNSLGGIKFDVPEDMVSKKADLDLKEGVQTLDGHDALAYARARTFEVGNGNGSDIQRIDRQQDLLKAFADQLLSANTLTDPQKTYAVTESILESVTVSPEIGNAGKIASFAYSLRNISSDNINFYTIPNEEWSQDHNRVIWTDEADSYWEALNNDEPIVEESTETDQNSNSESNNNENVTESDENTNVGEG